jgi:hypothetical protein
LNCFFTFTGPETIFKHTPRFLISSWIFSPTHLLHTYISKHVNLSLSILIYPPSWQ